MPAVRFSVFLLVFLAGCHAHAQLHAGSATPQGGVEVHVGGGRGLALLLGLSALAAGTYGYESARTSPPELAPDRRVSEQDCTRPLDLTQGNIRCK